MSESWRELAACKGKYEQADTTFDHPVGADAKRFVKEFCEAPCPVRVECLKYARSVEGPGPRWGAYGGLMGAERDGLVLFGYRRCADCRARFIPTKKQHQRCVDCRLGRTTRVAGPVSVHGTRAGYEQHLRRGDDPCWGCRDAMVRYSRWRTARARGAA